MTVEQVDGIEWMVNINADTFNKTFDKFIIQATKINLSSEPVFWLTADDWELVSTI
jgi:hypothetical protein